MLLVMSNERKNIIFYKKESKLTKNNTLNNVFCDIIIPHYRFLLTFKKDWIFINHGLFFGKNI